jgi:hypothetical protein
MPLRVRTDGGVLHLRGFHDVAQLRPLDLSTLRGIADE